MRIEKIILNSTRDVTLTALLQEETRWMPAGARRPAVLVLPGGGYDHLADRESDPPALAFAGAGYQVFILRYSIREHADWPNPLQDYDQAMEQIKSHAKEWGVAEDKIAVLGFSAGGHLAGAAATMAKNRPNAAILGYAVLSEDARLCHPSAPDTVSAVDEKTPPCFLFATRTDAVVPVRNTIAFSAALAEKGIPFESHIYAYGPHGFSICTAPVQDLDPAVMCRRTPNWVGDCISWLGDVFGRFDRGHFEKPLCPGCE